MLRSSVRSRGYPLRCAILAVKLSDTTKDLSPDLAYEEMPNALQGCLGFRPGVPPSQPGGSLGPGDVLLRIDSN